MSKVTLTFDRSNPDDNAEFLHTIKAQAAHAALWAIGEEVFRPARKHGYADPAIQTLFDQYPDHSAELISALEKRFYEILEQEGIEL